MRQLAYVGEDGQIRLADLDLNREIEITRRADGESRSEERRVGKECRL